MNKGVESLPSPFKFKPGKLTTPHIGDATDPNDTSKAYVGGTKQLSTELPQRMTGPDVTPQMAMMPGAHGPLVMSDLGTAPKMGWGERAGTAMTGWWQRLKAWLSKLFSGMQKPAFCEGVKQACADRGVSAAELEVWARDAFKK